jgi:GTP-binding protein EngB required for normal cell division
MLADSLLPLIDRLLLLISDSERFHAASADHSPAHESVRSVLEEFRLTVNSIRNRVVAASQRYVVAFVGAGNVGKSTLLNRLFGTDLAPRRNGPCTACPVEFRYGEQYTVTVEYLQSIRKPHYSFATSDEVSRCLSHLADSDGAQSSECIRRVCVTAPLDLLRNNGLLIADTPGFGAAQTNEAEGSHQEALKRYLERDVAQVLWVVLAEQGITKSEADFHGTFFSSICHDIIVTGSEDYSDQDKSRFRKRFSSLFDSIPPDFHFVSGRTGMGVDELSLRIASIDGRLTSAEEKLANIAMDFRTWVLQHREANPYQRCRVWNPTTWAQWNQQFHDHAITTILAFD